MKKIIGVVVLFLTLTTFTGCMSFLKGAPDTSKYIADERNEKWIQDINYLKDTLPKLHKNLYFMTSEKEFLEKLEELKKKVPELTDEQINIEMSLIVSGMGDTHTNVNKGFEESYPLQLYWYEEGIYIVNTDINHKDILNTRLISINDMPIEEVAEKFKPFFVGANENWFKNMVMYYLVYPDMLKYLKIIDNEKIKLEVANENKESRIVYMEPVTYDESLAPVKDESSEIFYKSHPYKNYWYEYLEDKNIMYININRSLEMEDMPFEIFTQNLFRDMKGKNISKCVIDLRQNQGGDSIIKPLLKGLKKSDLNSKGKLYVIIGRKTYSNGVNAAMLFKKETEAVFIGECTGGSPNHYGHTKSFKLPNSEINVTYSRRYIKSGDDNLQTLVPDVDIPVRFIAESKGEDEALNYVEMQ